MRILELGRRFGGWLRAVVSPGRTISIRWSLLRSFVLLIVISSVTVIILMSIRSRRTEAQLSKELIDRGKHLAARVLDGFFRPANDGARIAARWGLAGKLDLREVLSGPAGETTTGQREAARRLNSLLLPYLLAHKDVLSSVQVATERDEGFLILILPDGRIRNRVVARQRWGTRTLWFDVAGDGSPTAWEWKEVDYRPRERPWYAGVLDLAEGEIYWTDPYVFYTTRDLGITASARWSSGGVTHVVAYDVLLTAVTRFTQGPRARVSDNSLVFIATAEDWRVIGLPRHPRFTDDDRIRARFLQPLDSLEMPQLQAAIAAYDTVARPEVFSFDCGGEGWWAGLERYVPGSGRTLNIVVLVPNKDLLGDVTTLRVYLLMATIVALLGAFVYSLLLARAYSRPLEALAAQSRRIQNLDFTSDIKIEARLTEFQTLAEAQQQSLLALQSFSRYVPIDVVRDLVSAGQVARIGGRTVELTVLFTDIAGFTHIAEGMTPRDLTDHMARYFQAMIGILQERGATVDKLVGDAIVAFWGAPRAMEDHASRAADAVIQCRRLLEELNTRWSREGLPALPTRFGLATGPVVVGNIGAPSRLAYTVLGDTVNLASRLEGLNKVYGTCALADESAYRACGDAFAWRRLDRVIVLGQTRPGFVYEILGVAGDLPPAVIARARCYEQAWDAYAARDFEGALASLGDLLDGEAGDGAALRLLHLCRTLSREPPGPDWDATTRMDTK